MERAQTLSADATHVPDTTGTQGGVSQSNGDAESTGEVATVKRNDNVLESLLVLVMVVIVAIMLLVVDVAHAETYVVVTNGGAANVREQPDIHSDDIGDVCNGDLLIGTGYEDGWVLCDGYTIDGAVIALPVEAGQGWVSEKCLTLDGVPTGEYANTSGGRVNIRTEPDGKHASWLDAGHTVDVICWVAVDGSAWAYTKKGYIKFDCLEE